jgi:multisubunit Na+/H+ antiporter MnhF subunit
MHTLKVIAGGFILLAVCLLIGRLVGGQSSADGLVGAAKLFIPLWLLVAGVNLWIGVTRAGYTVAEEAPIFLVVFAVPATVALLLVWWLSRA